MAIILMELNYSLVLAESRNEMKTLIQLGYTPKMISSFIWKTFIMTISITSSIAYSIYVIYTFKAQSLLSLTGFNTPLINIYAVLIGTLLITTVIVMFKIDLNKVLHKYSYKS